MENVAAVLVAIGQTLAFVGAIVIAVTARLRARQKSQATWAMLKEFDRVVDRRLAKDAIGWGAGIVLAGLALAALGAWLQVAA